MTQSVFHKTWNTHSLLFYREKKNTLALNLVQTVFSAQVNFYSSSADCAHLLLYEIKGNMEWSWAVLEEPRSQAKGHLFAFEGQSSASPKLTSDISDPCKTRRRDSNDNPSWKGGVCSQPRTEGAKEAAKKQSVGC